MSSDLNKFVLHHCDATAIRSSHCVQQLWSDYGQIMRLELVGGDTRSVILKRVQWPAVATHPRGWHGRAGEQRKRDSYVVEACWYERYAAHAPHRCRVPKPVAVEQASDGMLILMEDLDNRYPERYRQDSLSRVAACLRWLAAFHAHHLNDAGDGLWPVGTYWHLGTRADEFAAMQEGRLKNAAQWLDGQLRDARFQTLVHGDAKLANFCFSSDATSPAYSSAASARNASVAAVDFQYVGRGPGVCDVAYFLGSCLDEVRLEQAVPALLDIYFSELGECLIDTVDASALEAEWRSLYPIAWVDFYRFLLGWAPEHRKINAYTRRLANEVLGA